MNPPEIKVLGAYRVEFTEELLQNVMESKYGGIELSEKQKTNAENAVREELSSIVLLDVKIDNPDEKCKIDNFRQPDADQAPYDEAYLSSDGKSIISRTKRPLGNSIRVAFFFHYFDPSKPLMSSYGIIPIPTLQEMPKYMKELMPYIPVD